MSTIEKLQWRYATKKFDATKSLSKEKLSILKEAFNLTALSYGLQTLKLVVVEDKVLRESLVKVSYGQRQVADASHLLVLCIQTAIDNKDVDAHFNTWASKQAYIALGNLMTVCAIEGIDSCPMEGFVPNKLDEALGLEKHGLNSVLLLPVGYRAEDDMFAELKKVRKQLSETVIEL